MGAHQTNKETMKKKEIDIFMVVVVIELVSSKTSRTLTVLLFLGHNMLKIYSWFCDQGWLLKVLRGHM